VYDLFFRRSLGVANLKGEQYLRIYVSVSGATGHEDERCALAATGPIEEFCDYMLDEDGMSGWQKYLSLLKPE
jgi:hypothetical protein